MKILLLYMFISCGCFGQKNPLKHNTIHNTFKQHDSTYYSIDADTTFGTIEYNVDGGRVISKGMLRHWQSITWNVRVPIDTSCTFCGATGYSNSLNTHTDAYIWYNGKWKRLDYDNKFIFKPNQ